MLDKDDLYYKIVDKDGIIWAAFRWKVDAERYLRDQIKFDPIHKVILSIVEIKDNGRG